MSLVLWTNVYVFPLMTRRVVRTTVDNMTTLFRSRVALNGWIGSPGVNTFYWTSGFSSDDDQTDVNNMHELLADAYDSLAALFLQDVRWEVEGAVSLLDSATGNLVGNVAQSTPVRFGYGTSGSRNIDRAAMVTTALQTDQYVDGRRLAGRVFLGPIGGDSIRADGLITEAKLAAIPAAFSTMIGELGVRLAVFHRPSADPGGDGYYGDVNTVVARSVPGTLRSRKR